MVTPVSVKSPFVALFLHPRSTRAVLDRSSLEAAGPLFHPIAPNSDVLALQVINGHRTASTKELRTLGMGRHRQQTDRVTIQAVAERAGVSTMTVSNVFNRTGKVGDATRTRVLAVIEELGYVPNQTARRLVGSALARVGLIYSGNDSVFTRESLAAVAVVAAEKGLQLLIRTARGATAAQTAEIARGLIGSGAQALLLMPPYAELLAGAPELQTLNVPIAAITTALSLPGIATVRIDNHAAAFAITERLISRGRRRIAVIAGPSANSDSTARLEGHLDALRTHGLPVSDDLCIEGDFSFACGLEATDKLLDLAIPPDAIVAANDDMAAAVLWAAHRRGTKLPSELAVTGFDDTLLATRIWPALTTIHQPIEAMASEALELLALAVRGSGEDETRDVVLPYQLVARQSD
jgi:LacI family transcriptional regulator